MEYYVKSVVPIIESNYDKFTTVERNIADFFIQNRKKVDFSSKSISERLFVSEASLSRFAKKCGYRIFEEAKKGDKICNRAIDEMTDVLGKGIANICYVVNPEVVVLGGGIMAQEAFLKDKIEKAVEKYLVSSMWEHTSIAFAKNQNNAGMLGAFYHFQGRHA